MYKIAYKSTENLERLMTVYFTDCFLEEIKEYFSDANIFEKIPVYEKKSMIKEPTEKELNAINDEKLMRVINSNYFSKKEAPKEKETSVYFWKTVLLYITKALKCKEIYMPDAYEEMLLSGIIYLSKTRHYDHPIKEILLEEMSMYLEEVQIKADEETGLFDEQLSRKKAMKQMKKYKDTLETPACFFHESYDISKYVIWNSNSTQI